MTLAIANGDIALLLVALFIAAILWADPVSRQLARRKPKPPIAEADLDGLEAWIAESKERSARGLEHAARSKERRYGRAA